MHDRSPGLFTSSLARYHCTRDSLYILSSSSSEIHNYYDKNDDDDDDDDDNNDNDTLPIKIPDEYTDYIMFIHSLNTYFHLLLYRHIVISTLHSICFYNCVVLYCGIILRS